MMRHFLWLVTLPALALPVHSNCPAGQQSGHEYLVRYTKTSQGLRSVVAPLIPDRVLAISRSRGRVGHAPDIVLTLFKNPSDEQLSSWDTREDVLSVEQNCWVERASVAPNDPLYGKQWAHAVIGAPAAWEKTTGSPDVIVAIVDTGVDVEHIDLKANLWTNVAERDGKKGIDDDRNGYIDDVHGYNFAERNGNPSPGTADIDMHGTHVAGLVGAVGNNKMGVTGVAWSTRLMALKVFPNGGQNASLAAMLEGVDYAAHNGARIVNCSWSRMAAPTEAERQVFSDLLAADVLPVVAAGNNASDVAQSSPGSIPGVLNVGAINGSMELAQFSNYGPTIGILAPGTAIYSTVPGSQYDYLTGTSMAAPLVAGAASLLLSLHPELHQSDLQRILVQTGTPMTADGQSYRLLNVGQAILTAY